MIGLYENSLGPDDPGGWIVEMPLERLLTEATRLRHDGHGRFVSYSRKVFIPLTRLCRDVCHYCAFAKPPRTDEPAFLTPDEILTIAQAGREAGCHEALFTLGDHPELRYEAARRALTELGYPSTHAYLVAMCRLVLSETGLLPHANPGVMSACELSALRHVTVSQGLMLESASERLCAPGGPHHGSPDKRPEVRLDTIQAAGELAIPITTGLLVGIGETREERLHTLIILRDLHRSYGHIQEVIIQPFRPKPGTRMADAAPCDETELLWTIAAARLVFGPAINIQSPPNLMSGGYAQLLNAGINDWGGVSPVTADHVNPEAPWPHLDDLRSATGTAGFTLVERLPVYPAYARDAARWLDPAVRPAVLAASDGDGYARTEAWAPGLTIPPPALWTGRGAPDPAVTALVERAQQGDRLTEAEIAALFRTRDPDLRAVLEAADRLRARICGEGVTYVVNRNINYTNLCQYGCRFCAFSKGPLGDTLRGQAYDLTLTEIGARAAEAWDRGATEVCLQGGIHPRYTGDTYLAILDAVRSAAPAIHIHAFSPLEIMHGATTLGIPVSSYLERLQAAGLGSLPGTAAEILDDMVRAVLCPDKLDTADWLRVVETAHAVGLRTTATIMFGHVDGPDAWARHLTVIRTLQERTGGFTEFVPLPYVHMEAPLYRKGQSRRGPTFREAVLMHAVARLALHPVLTSIQTSWVKMGPQGAQRCLQAGANDLGGTLMNESITRAAGTEHGQELPPADMEALIKAAGRTPRQRTTLYGGVAETVQRRSNENSAIDLTMGTHIHK